jgi:hypothetical protein
MRPPTDGPSTPDARRALSLRQELARKTLHLTSAVVPVAYAAGVPREPLLALLAVLLVAAFLVELTRRRVHLVRQAFHRATHPLLRAHEHERLSGATWLLVAFVLVVWLCPRAMAIAAMWAVAVGDAAAAVVGGGGGAPPRHARQVARGQPGVRRGDRGRRARRRAARAGRGARRRRRRGRRGMADAPARRQPAGGRRRRARGRGRPGAARAGVTSARQVWRPSVTWSAAPRKRLRLTRS